MGDSRVGSCRDLHDTAKLTCLLRNVREGLRFDAGSCVRRLHAGILRHCCFVEHHDSCLRDGMVLPAVHRSHSVVRLSIHVRCGSWIYVHYFDGMELRVRLWICLLSLLLAVLGTDGLLRLWLVSIVWLGSVGRSSGGQRVRGVGEYGLLPHGRGMGKSIYRKLWCGDTRRLLQHSDRQEHSRRTGLQHEYLHG